MLKALPLSICAGFLLRATCHAAELTEDTASGPVLVAPKVDFQSLRIKGLIVALPGPQDIIDPDFAGIRSSLAALGSATSATPTTTFTTTCCPQNGARSASSSIMVRSQPSSRIT